MAELTISSNVGAPPAANRTADVRTVQLLLRKVQPPLRTAVAVTGLPDSKTVEAIREFQKRFMAHPDGRVDADGRTLMHLNDGFASSYIGCDPNKRVTIDRDIIDAQKWLDLVSRRLSDPNDADMRRKVQNIFHVDVGSPGHEHLRSQVRALRQSLDDNLTFQCEKKTNAFAAWVQGSDPTIHLALNYFSNSPEVRIAKLIHERSHTVLRTDHSGMHAGGEVNFGVAPDDPNAYAPQQAIRNAYCYEWLVTALQPGYDPEKARSF